MKLNYLLLYKTINAKIIETLRFLIRNNYLYCQSIQVNILVGTNMFHHIVPIVELVPI